MRFFSLFIIAVICALQVSATSYYLSVYENIRSHHDFDFGPYDFEVVTINDAEAKLRINGEITGAVGKNDVEMLSDGSKLRVIEIGVHPVGRYVTLELNGDNVIPADSAIHPVDAYTYVNHSLLKRSIRLSDICNYVGQPYASICHGELEQYGGRLFSTLPCTYEAFGLINDKPRSFLGLKDFAVKLDTVTNDYAIININGNQ